MKNVMKEMEYISVQMINDCCNVSSEETLRFVMKIKRNVPQIDSCQFGIVIRNHRDAVVGALYSQVVSLPKDADLMEVEIDFANHQLAKGKYSLNFNISYNDYNSEIRDLDVVWDVIRFEVNYRDEAHTQPFTLWKLGDMAFTAVKPRVKAL